MTRSQPKPRTMLRLFRTLRGLRLLHASSNVGGGCSAPARRRGNGYRTPSHNGGGNYREPPAEVIRQPSKGFSSGSRPTWTRTTDGSSTTAQWYGETLIVEQEF